MDDKLKLHHFSRLQVDSENLKNQADKIKAEAERIADDAERLMSDNQGLIQESYDRRTRLKDDLLERYNISSTPKPEFDSRRIMFSKKNTHLQPLRAKSQKKSVDAQYQNMVENKERAETAVAEGNAVLKDAGQTLSTLQGQYKSDIQLSYSSC